MDTEREVAERIVKEWVDRFVARVPNAGTYAELSDAIAAALTTARQQQREVVEVLREAAEANRAWTLAEQHSLGSFQARMELCNYADWLTRKALGAQSDYEGVPRLLLDTEKLDVVIARCDVENCKALIRETIAAAIRAEGEGGNG